MPISNNKKLIQEAPANLFYGCQLKAHLPVKRKPMVIQNLDDDVTSEVSSKYSVGEEVWVKLDTNMKWIPVIGTMYCNYHRPSLIIIFIFSRSSPKDPVTLKSGAHMSYTDLCVPSQALQ